MKILKICSRNFFKLLYFLCTISEIAYLLTKEMNWTWKDIKSQLDFFAVQLLISFQVQFITFVKR